jgi:hypothetical protein
MGRNRGHICDLIDHCEVALCSENAKAGEKCWQVSRVKITGFPCVGARFQRPHVLGESDLISEVYVVNYSIFILFCVVPNRWVTPIKMPSNRSQREGTDPNGSVQALLPGSNFPIWDSQNSGRSMSESDSLTMSVTLNASPSEQVLRRKIFNSEQSMIANHGIRRREIANHLRQMVRGPRNDSAGIRSVDFQASGAVTVDKDTTESVEQTLPSFEKMPSVLCR